MPAGEASRLRFFAAAARALRVAGVRDRATLFAGIVRRGPWENVAQRDEDATRAMLVRPVTPRRAPDTWPAPPDLELTDAVAIRRIIEESLDLCGCDGIIDDGRWPEGVESPSATSLD